MIDNNLYLAILNYKQNLSIEKRSSENWISKISFRKEGS